MSKFYYARFKETEKEIIAFPTQEQRDDWIKFNDEFSKSTGSSVENATFERIPLTDQQANYIIKTFGLTETKEKDLTGNTITIFKNTAKGEGKVMKRNNKISLQPTMGLTERKMIASATVKNAIVIGTKKLA